MSNTNYICVLIFICCLLHIPNCESLKILGVFPSPSKSHTILGQALLKGLAAKGHQVTMISPYPLPKPVPNYRDLIVTDLKSLMFVLRGKEKHDFAEMYSGSTIRIVSTLYEMGYNMSSASLRDNAFQKILNSGETFDIIICVLLMNEVFLALSDHYKVPIIAFSTLVTTEWTNALIGNPTSYAYTPMFTSDFSDHMTFFERVKNVYSTMVFDLYYHYIHIPKQEKLREIYLPHTKPLSQILTNVSLLLISSHPSLYYPLPMVPNMIEIGGFHVEPPKPIPSDLKKLLDESKNGVIYFSMGSNVLAKDLPDSYRRIFLKVFGGLKQTVLWKWEDDNLPDQPKNVKISAWFPQSDLLAHPNIKVFITHGGLLSTTEAISRGIPLLGIPVFGDQKLNAARAETLGYGLMLDYYNITEDSMTWSLNELLNNPKYYKEAKKRSAILNDRLVSPLDEAIYWVEYVERHKGATHLRTARNDLHLFQYLLLDVVAFVFGVFIFIVFVAYFVCKKMCSLFVRHNKLKTQ